MVMGQSSISIKSVTEEQGPKVKDSFSLCVHLIQKDYSNNKTVSAKTISLINERRECFSMLKVFESHPFIYRQLLNSFWKLSKIVMKKDEFVFNYRFLDWKTLKLAILVSKLNSPEGFEYLSEFVEAFESAKFNKISGSVPVFLKDAQDCPFGFVETDVKKPISPSSIYTHDFSSSIVIDEEKLRKLSNGTIGLDKEGSKQYLFASVFNFENFEENNFLANFSKYLPNDQEVKKLLGEAKKMVEYKKRKTSKEPKNDEAYFKLYFELIPFEYIGYHHSSPVHIIFPDERSFSHNNIIDVLKYENMEYELPSRTIDDLDKALLHEPHLYFELIPFEYIGYDHSSSVHVIFPDERKFVHNNIIDVLKYENMEYELPSRAIDDLDKALLHEPQLYFELIPFEYIGYDHSSPVHVIFPDERKFRHNNIIDVLKYENMEYGFPYKTIDHMDKVLLTEPQK